MVWTMSPLRRTTKISLSSPRERSNASMSPTGDQTGFESLRPAATGTSGRTNSGSSPAGSACSSANAGSAAAANKTSRERTSSLFLDLVAVSARRLAGLHESVNTLELFREEVEVLAPRQARAVHHRWLLDRKSTRLNSSHVSISYAVFCLKKKKKNKKRHTRK